MRSTRTIWRGLTAVLRIVVLLTVIVPGLGHAHAGASRLGSAHLASAHAASAHAADADSDAPRPISAVRADHGGGEPAAVAQAGDAASPGHQGHASCHCGCHPDFGDPADATLSVRWRCSRAMTPAAEQAFVSRSPEALPEPPRSFA